MFGRLTSAPPLPPGLSMTTLATVKLEIGIESDKTDAYLQRAIARASAQVASWCGREFVQQTVTDTFRQATWFDPSTPGYWFSKAYPVNPASYQLGVLLARYPITSITSMTTDSTLLVEGTDFEADYEAGIIYALDGAADRVGWYFGTAVVVYTAGYVMPADSGQPARTLPYDLEGAVIDIVRAKYYARGRDPNLRSQSQPNGGETQYQVTANGTDGELPMGVSDVLSRYRAPGLI